MLDSPIDHLVQRMRGGELDPLELVATHIRRMERVNPRLNALIAERYEAAREEAIEARERHAAGDEAPLLGVPCTIKEFLRVTGMPFTGGGIPARARITAGYDAVIVQRLRAAGAIVLGVTNAPEGGIWMETGNRQFGRTNNPWNLRRTSGGSSGGEGAAVSSGAAVFGIGSDVGGSVRIPAAMCGTFGHKPSGGLVPNTDHWPDDPMVGRMLCTGPLTRSAADLRRVLEVIAGPDGQDLSVEDRPIGPPLDPRDLVVYPVTGNGFVWVRPAMKKAIERATKALVDAGARVGEFPAKRLKQGFDLWAAAIANNGSPSYAELLGDGMPIPLLKELRKALVGRSKHTLPAIVAAGLEEVTHVLGGRVERALAAIEPLRQEIEETLGATGVMLHPPYTRPAPRHGLPMLTPFDAACTAPFNALHLPSTVAPVGFHKGLPVGVQIIGRRWNDGVTIGAAEVLERALGGWQRSEP